MGEGDGRSHWRSPFFDEGRFGLRSGDVWASLDLFPLHLRFPPSVSGIPRRFVAQPRRPQQTSPLALRASITMPRHETKHRPLKLTPGARLQKEWALTAGARQEPARASVTVIGGELRALGRKRTALTASCRPPASLSDRMQRGATKHSKAQQQSCCHCQPAAHRDLPPSVLYVC